MADQSAEATRTEVSPLRRKISAAVLLALVVVLLIEVRAGAGHSLSGNALQAVSEEGVFQNKLLSDVEAMIRIAPQKTIVRENVDEVEYRYSWFSLLRPLLQRPKAELFVVATRNYNPPYALLYNTEAPSQQNIDAGRRMLDNFGVPEPDNGMEEQGGDPGTSGAHFGGRQRQPAQDELSGGSQSSPSESRRRPPMDDKPDESGESSEALEASSDESKTEAAKELPRTDSASTNDTTIDQ